MKDNAIPHWKTEEKRVVTDNNFLTLTEQDRIEKGTGKKGTFYILESRDWGNIVAITPENELVMIRQFRQATETIELEVAGGIIDDGEDPGDAMVRELREETGYVLTDESELLKLGEVYPNPAILTNTSYTYLATNVVRTGTTKFDEHENIEVELIPRNKIDDVLRSGQIRHALTIASLYWLELSGR